MQRGSVNIVSWNDIVITYELTVGVVTCTRFYSCWGMRLAPQINKFSEDRRHFPPPLENTKTFLGFCILIKFLPSIFQTYLLSIIHYWFHFKNQVYCYWYYYWGAHHSPLWRWEDNFGVSLSHFLYMGSGGWLRSSDLLIDWLKWWVISLAHLSFFSPIFLFYLIMLVFDSLSVCGPHVCSAQKGQKRAVDPLRLKL